MTTANYTVSSDNESRFQIEFKEGTTNVVGLQAAPDQLEPNLRCGAWLVLAFAVWDSKDRPAIDIACEIAASASNFSVAVRPFEFGKEFESWVPGFSSNAGVLSVVEYDGHVEITTHSDDHPMWLALDNGHLVAVLIGARECLDVEKFAKQNFGPVGGP